VNGIAPSVVETDGLTAALSDDLRRRIVSATPLHRLATVTDVASTARWLACLAASYVTGKIIEIDGGAEAPTFPDDTPDLQPGAAGTGAAGTGAAGTGAAGTG
jgi:7-alpha-hydroxysteroid dehydrogenase